jgi:hypothetical protein
MSTILALYVYSPAHFTINQHFDGYSPSRTFDPGNQSLAAGVYRLPSGTSVTPAAGADFELVTITIPAAVAGNKDPKPDPGPRAISVLHFDAEKAKAYFGGSGSASTF